MTDQIVRKMGEMKLADQRISCQLLLLNETHQTALPSFPHQPQSWCTHSSPSLVPPLLTATTTTTTFPTGIFRTDAAATPATAASISSSPEVADCCEVCFLVRRLSALLTFAFLFDVCWYMSPCKKLWSFIFRSAIFSRLKHACSSVVNVLYPSSRWYSEVLHATYY